MTIVVGYSPSGQGIAALQAAAGYAKKSEESLVIASHLYHDPEVGAAVASEEAALAAAAAAGADVEKVSVRSCSQSDIGEFLLSVAEDEAASLLVIGLRRKSPIGKLNLGGSARRVVLGAPCPVLAVKDDYTVSGT